LSLLIGSENELKQDKQLMIEQIGILKYQLAESKKTQESLLKALDQGINHSPEEKDH